MAMLNNQRVSHDMSYFVDTSPSLSVLATAYLSKSQLGRKGVYLDH